MEEEKKNMYEIGKEVQGLYDFSALQTVLNEQHAAQQRGNFWAFAILGACVGWIFGEIRSLKKKMKETDKETEEDS